MKIRYIHVVAICVLMQVLNTVNAQPGFSWAKAIGGTSNDDWGYSITTDNNSNVYTVGYFDGTVDFDPGAAIYNLTSTNGGNLFISKMDSAGNFVWAKNMGGSTINYGPSVAVDGNENVYITGWFNGTCDFDPGVTTYDLTSVGNHDIFVCKLNPSGNLSWVKSMGGPGDDVGNSISVDASGNVYTTGSFSASVDFDPGAAVYNLTSAGSWDIFTSKLDAAGNFIWANSIGSTLGDEGRDLTVDNAGNVYITGLFQGTVDFDPGAGTYPLTEAGNADIFICKLNQSGNFVWANGFGNAGTDYGFSIAIDASNNVYTTGVFSGTVDFDPSATTYSMSGGGAFISKLNSSGNFVLAKQITGNGGGPIGLGIAVDANNNIYTTGFFSGTADFDPGATQYNLTSSGFDIFVSKLDASGNFSCAGIMGGSSDERGYSIAVDAAGAIYTTGFFTSAPADFNPGAGSYPLNSLGTYDVFISKLTGCSVNAGINHPSTSLSEIKIFPNPSTGKILLIDGKNNSEKNREVVIYDLLGKKIEKKALDSEKTEIDLTGKEKGIYFLEINNGVERRNEKIVIQ